MPSLINVAAAVWAMTAVIALGNTLTNSQDAITVQSTGIVGTATLTAEAGNSGFKNGDGFGDGGSGDNSSTGIAADSFGSFDGAGAGGNEPNDLSVIDPDRPINGAFSAATRRLIGTTHTNLWP